MEDSLDLIASQLGLDPAMLVVALVVLSMFSRLVGKLIPDDKTGFLGFVRQAAKIIGLYTSNRIRSGVSVSDVADASMSIPQVAKDARGSTMYSPAWVAVISLGVMLALSGCSATTALTVSQKVCDRQVAIRAAAEAAIKVVNQCPVPEGN